MTHDPIEAEDEVTYPPHWLAEAAAGGMGLASRASTHAGAIEYALWRAVQDATAFDYELAKVPLPGNAWTPPGTVGTWILAARNARALRAASETDHEWQARLRFVWTGLGERDRADARRIVAALDLHWPSGPSRPVRARGFTEEQIRAPAVTVRTKTGEAPDQDAVARTLGTSVRTMRRAMEDLGNKRKGDPTMTLWVVKGGGGGEREARMIASSVLAIGWEELGDLSTFASRETLKSSYRDTFPDDSTGRVNVVAGQLWAFVHAIAEGDTVVVPLKTSSRIAVGTVSGPYRYSTEFGADMSHLRPVKWLATDVPVRISTRICCTRSVRS